MKQIIQICKAQADDKNKKNFNIYFSLFEVKY